MYFLLVVNQFVFFQMKDCLKISNAVGQPFFSKIGLFIRKKFIFDFFLNFERQFLNGRIIVNTSLHSFLQMVDKFLSERGEKMVRYI